MPRCSICYTAFIQFKSMTCSNSNSESPWTTCFSLSIHWFPLAWKFCWRKQSFSTAFPKGSSLLFNLTTPNQSLLLESKLFSLWVQYVKLSYLVSTTVKISQTTTRSGSPKRRSRCAKTLHIKLDSNFCTSQMHGQKKGSRKAFTADGESPPTWSPIYLDF